MNHGTSRRILSLLLVLVLALSFPCAFAAAAGEETYTFQILFTSDTHGSFSDWSYSTNSASTGMARVATLIKERLANGYFQTGSGPSTRDDTLLIDVGDTIQGNGTSVFLSDKWQGKLYPSLIGMEYLGYEAWVLGNHEFNFGFENLYKAYGKGTDYEFSGTVLAGNVIDASGKQVFAPYYIKTMSNGMRVAVISCVTPNIDAWDASNLNRAGVTTRSATVVTEETIRYLQSEAFLANNEPVDLFIAAQHMGNKGEYGREGSGADDVLGNDFNAEHLAVFLGAHYHTNRNESINGVQYVEVRNAGAALGTVTITATKVNGEWSVEDKAADVKAEIVPANERVNGAYVVPADQGYMQALAEADAFGKAYANEVVGKLSGGQLVPDPEIKDTYEGYLQDNALVHLINDAMIHYTGAQLAGTAHLDTNSNAYPGDLSRGDISTIYKYDNNTLYLIEMTGHQFKKWMERSYAFIGPYKGDGNVDKGPAMTAGDLTIPYGNGNIAGYNLDHFAGLSYQVDLTKPVGERVVNMKNLDGTAFDMSATYTVAVNNYRVDTHMLGSNTIFDEGEVRPVVLKTEITSEWNGEGMLGVMVDYISNVKGGEITNDFDQNWSYILPRYEPFMRAAAVAFVNEGAISIMEEGNGYARRAVTAAEVETLLLPALDGVTGLDGHWARNAVAYLAHSDLLDAPKGEFAPDAAVPAAELEALLTNVSGVAGTPATVGALAEHLYCVANDVASSGGAAIDWAVKEGLLIGNEHGVVNGDLALTRALLCTVLARFAA